MATGSDRIVGDNIAAYASSAHSPTSESMMSGASRNRKRSEVFATHESPYFFPAHQLYNVMSMDRSTRYGFAKVHSIELLTTQVERTS